MRRIVLIVPELLAFDALRQKLSTLQTMAELGLVFKLAVPPQVETPEALWLGMDPREGQLKQGPLTVAALGADPPDRSTHFHLTPMSFTDGVASEIVVEIPPNDQRSVMEAAQRLNTKTLTIVEGRSRDHGLVWEGLGDLGTSAAAAVSGKRIQEWLPEGDAESMLRRFIDDSANLLTELPMNQERFDEGLPPINLLWPWGHGVRKPVPNLTLRRGERANVFSGSLRLAGLSRLTGYKHGDRLTFGRGVNTRLSALAEHLLSSEASISVIDAAVELAKRDKPEEVNWLAREIDQQVLAPLFNKALTESTRIVFLVPSEAGGLALAFEAGDRHSNSAPLDERALEEKSLMSQDLWTAVEQGIVWTGPAKTPA